MDVKKKRKSINAILTIIKRKQGGRVALAYFLPEYKVFDQLLQTVKIETTV